MSHDFLKIAINAALEAAKEILKIYNSDDFEVQLKSQTSQKKLTATLDFVSCGQNSLVFTKI